MIAIREAQDDDLDAIREVHRLAFADDIVPALVGRLHASAAHIPALSLVAVTDGTVVGHIAFSRAHVDDHPVLLLSPLGVLPAFQRRGVGRALVGEGLRLADELRESLAIVEGIPAYYPRFGFEPHELYGITPPSPHIPREAFMIRPLRAYDPSIRGTTRYPAAFDGL